MTDSSMTDSSMTDSSSIIGGLKAHGINLLAVDFDRTLCAIHTGGRFKGSAEDLSALLRVRFVSFLKEVLANDIQVAIVTFSCQTKLITAVLKLVFSEDVANNIVVRGNDYTWEHEGYSPQNGKQLHLNSVKEHFANLENVVKITYASTVLIDDDRKNIDIALQNKVRAVWCDPENSSSVLTGLHSQFVATLPSASAAICSIV